MQERKYRKKELLKDKEERQVLFRRGLFLTNRLKCEYRVHCQRGLGLHHQLCEGGEDDQTDLLQANRIQRRRPDGCGEGGRDGAPGEGLEDQAACQRDAGAHVQCSLDLHKRDVVDEAGKCSSQQIQDDIFYSLSIFTMVHI